MEKEVNKGNSEPAERSVETDNMSEADFVSLRTRIKDVTAPPEDKSKESAVESGQDGGADNSGDEGNQGEGADDKAKIAEVLSKAKSEDLESLSEDELAIVAKAIGSKAVARFGELTAKRKAAEEKAAALEARLNAQLNAAPTEDVENNPFSTVETREQLAEKARSIEIVLDQIEDALDVSEGRGPDEVVVTEGNTQYTRSQLKKIRRDLKTSKDKYIPAQLRVIEKAEATKAFESQLRDRAAKELEWMNDVDSEQRKAFDEMMSDKRVAGLQKKAPEIAAMLSYYLPHAVNSMYARKTIPLDEKKMEGAVKPKPPAAPATSAPPAKSKKDSDKAIEEAQQRFSQSGSMDDFKALRTAQFKRRTLA